MIQRYEVEAWLGPALDNMTAEQVPAFARMVEAIGDRYPDADEAGMRELASSGALLVMLRDSTLEAIAAEWQLAKRTEREAMAMLTGAIIAAAEGDTAVGIAKRAGVARETVRKALGK